MSPKFPRATIDVMAAAPRLLLINPPVVRPCEPPAGLARLAGTLAAAGVAVEIWDANLDGLLALLGQEPDAADTWTRRARRDRVGHLAGLRDGTVFAHPDTYRRAMGDLERLLARLPPVHLDHASLPGGGPTSVRAGEGPLATGPGPGDLPAGGRSRPGPGGRSGAGWHPSLTDCLHDHWEPTNSAHLRALAADPDGNPFLPILAEGLARRLAGGAFTHVGLSVNYLSQALTAFALAGHLRRTAPGLRLAMGGGLVTSWLARPDSRRPNGMGKEGGAKQPDHDPPGGRWPENQEGAPVFTEDGTKPLWRAELEARSREGTRVTPRPLAPGGPFAGLVDLLVPGPGEAALAAWLGATPVGDTPAVWSYAFDGLPLADYLSPGPVLPFSLAHGCFYAACSFCPETVEAGGYRPLPAALAIGRVQTLVRRHSPALVHFLDDAISPAVLRELAREGVEAPWYGFARFDTPLDDPEVCRALARRGCVMLQLGLESGDQAVLDALRKGIRLETVSRILYNLHKAGIGTYVYLLFGTPAEDRDAAHRTLRFVADHAAAIDYLNVAIFNLPRAAPEARGLPTRPFSQGDLGLYLEFTHPLGWNRGEVRRFLDTAFRHHPAIAPILHRDPPAFTSSHAPFFLLRQRTKSR